MSEQKTPEQEFATALVEFQKELPRVVKEQRANAGTYGYSYADLTDVTEAAMPLLTKHGLSFNAKPTLSEQGFVLRYALRHTGGHVDGGDYPLPDPSKTDAQKIGSAITYARRYSFCAATGIAPGGDDDDGAKANDARAADPLPRAPRRPNATERKGPEQTNQPDEWTTAPPEPQTDIEWVEAFKVRLTACGTPAEVDKADEEAHVAFADGKLTVDDARKLKTDIDARRAEIKGQPVGVGA